MFERIQFNNNRNLSLLKSAECDGYVCSLNDKFRKIAEAELGETDLVREQSLQLMRDWIVKSPSIITCRTDSLFLLRFLRVCKFSVPGACAKLENYLCIHQAYPKWFKNISIDDARVREMFEAEYLIPLPEKDHFGRQVLFFQTKNFDSKKFTSADLMHLAELVFQIFYDDEETQVGGFMCIFEDTGFNMGHITMWNLSDVRDAVKYVSRGMPIRSRGWHRVKFPSFGQTIFDFIKGLLSAKIKNRIQMFKSIDDLKELIDLRILPKEYNTGGKYTCKEIITEFIRIAESRKEEILMQEQMVTQSKRLEYYQSSEIISGINGSFRKLDVD